LYNKKQKIMAQETLTTSYLAQLTNAKLYYISGGKSGGDKPAPTPDPSGDGD